jgi:hypothetical protein
MDQVLIKPMHIGRIAKGGRIFRNYQRRPYIANLQFDIDVDINK